MRIQIASDLHLETYPSRLPPLAAFRPVADRDLLVLAGDIGQGLGARDFALRELTRSPVIYVRGNHEYYLQHRETIDADWRRLADQHAGLHYLVAEGAEIEGIRFWGAPWYSSLWGDYERAAHAAQTELLRAQARKVDVVVTHWPPTLRAMHPKFKGNALNAYFHNDADDLVRTVGAQLWISGHTHESHACQIGVTRCVGNPSGYAWDQQQSPHFRPDRVVEV